jgi:hypothetical protein
MISLNIEKIKVLQSNNIIYEFLLEGYDSHVYLGIDDEYSFPFQLLMMELINLADNKIYSNKLFNEWKIKLFRDISADRQKNINKSHEHFLLLTITNDLKGNIIFYVCTKDGGMVYRKVVKLMDFELFLTNFKEFNEQPYDSFNIYRLDKFFE